MPDYDRVTQAAAQVEYTNIEGEHVTQVAAVVEYTHIQGIRITQCCVMVEYVVIPSTGRVYGPALGHM